MNKKLNICHLTSVHQSHDIRIFYKECTSLAKKHEVVLLVANGVDEVRNNVEIRNVPVSYSGRIQRFTKVVNEMYRAALEINADVYHLHDPELLRIASKLLKKEKCVVFDAHEDLPRQLLSKPYLHPFAAKVLSRLVEYYENKVVAKLTGVVAATPHIQNRFLAVNPNTENINNYPVISELKLLGEGAESVRKQNVCYVGGITEIRGIKEMLNALKYTHEPVGLNLAGTFESEELKINAQQHPTWTKTKYYGFVDRAEVAKILHTSFAGLLTLHPTVNHIDSLPIKMFEYMLFGLPVIASRFPLWQEIIEKNKCGICVDSLNPQEIAQAIDYLYRNPEKAKEMGERGRKLVLEKYNWEQEEQKLLNFYELLPCNRK